MPSMGIVATFVVAISSSPCDSTLNEASRCLFRPSSTRAWGKPVVLARHDTPLYRRRDCSRGACGAPRRHWGTDGAAGPEERPRCTPDSQEHKGLFDTLAPAA